jgi:hypothetical protein
VHLSHGDVVASLAMNPLIAFCFLVAVPYLLYSLITLAAGIPRVYVDLTDPEKNALRIGAVLLALLNWTYLIFIFSNS